MISPRFLLAASSFLSSALAAADQWPSEVRGVEIPASDGKKQAALWFAPSTQGKKPLLVGLHTWSSSYASSAGSVPYAEWCVQQGWAFIHPDFRGPNKTPEAMGSDRAIKDVVDAVVWACKQTDIDPNRIYLVGVSGGAHMALLVAGRHPEIWAGVSAWCPISDLEQWYSERADDRYAKDIETCLGGSPLEARYKREARRRSPIYTLARAAAVPLDLNAGVHDGRTGAVPFTHAFRAYNAVLTDKSRQLNAKQIQEFYSAEKVPAGWSAAEPDPAYDRWTPLFRQVQNNTRITIFEGGHEIVHQAALNWLALQRKGTPAVWRMTSFEKLSKAGGESGK